MRNIKKTALLLVYMTLWVGVAEASAEAIVSGDWTYDGKTITAYNGTATDVTIPASLNGSDITAVGANVFKSSPGVQNIVIAEGIEELKDNAFAGLNNLYSISLPASIRIIGMVNDGRQLPVVNIPTLEAWMGISFSAPLGNSTNLYVGGELLTYYYPQFQGEYELKPYAFYGIKSLKKSALISGAHIPEYAFAESGIDGIGFNGDLETIGDNAFNNCMLVEIELPESVISIGAGAFASNSGLATIVLDKNLKTIGNNAFSGVNASAKIFSDAVVPPTATDAFDGSLKLSASLYVPSQSLEEYKKDWGFANTFSQTGSGDWTIDERGTITSYTGADSKIVIPEYIGSTKVSEIAKELFMDNTTITEVVFPDYAATVPARAFKGCSNLRKVVLGSNCQLIMTQAFEGCTSLNEINFPDKIREIGKKAFASSGLSQLIIPAQLYDIKEDAFLDCPVRNVYVSSIGKWLEISFAETTSNPIASGARLYVGGQELTSIRYWEQCIVKPYAFYGLESLASVSLIGATAIGDCAFYGCGNLKSVNVSHSGFIGNYAFFGCPLTGSINLEEAYSIGISAFQQPAGSEGFSELALGQNLRVIWEGAFLGHNNIKGIKSSALTPARLMAKKKMVTPVFEQSVRDNATLEVPFGTAEYYANLWEFKNISSPKASILKVLLPDNGSFSLIDPQEGTRVFIGSTDPEWELSAVYLGDEDIYETQITPDGYWIIGEIPEGESTLRVVMKKKEDSAISDVTVTDSKISVSKSGDIVTINNAGDNASVNVYDVSGKLLLSTNDHSFTLHHQGVILIRVDNMTFKFIN